MKLGNSDEPTSRRERVKRQQRRKGPLYQAYTFAFGTRRRAIISALTVLIVPIVLVQLFYPGSRVLPNSSVGAVSIGGMSKEAASNKLDGAYAKAKVPIYFSDSDEVVIEPTLANLGVTTDNTERIQAYDYPFIARLVPYSLFWYHALIAKGEPNVTRNDEVLAAYITERFGDDCEFEPVSATIAYDDELGELAVVDATRGGSCDPSELAKLKDVSARLAPESITITGTSTAPEISTKVAQAEYERVTKQLEEGVKLMVEDKQETIDTNTVSKWVQYGVVEGKLTLGLHGEKVSAWLKDTYGEKFTEAAGTTVVTLRDYAESSREEGNKGHALNSGETINGLVDELLGEQETAKLVIDTLEPAVEYKRTYSDSNSEISAIMKKYADTHAGTYGVKMVELSGARRNAEYNANAIFTTASTYKLFVAYSILLRIERGEMSWNDASYGGQSVSVCFDRMIELSDNNCAVWFLLKVSYAGVTADAHALGATNTNFVLRTGISSNAADEAHFLSLLYTGQLLSQQASRDRLIAAMKGNVYVAGIPSGIPNATVADKVGFLDGLLHDAAIVYSPKGDYVLIIMTDNASWANIAELASQIEAAR